jgi:NitT/TauT family transport system ATP-binding protein
MAGTSPQATKAPAEQVSPGADPMVVFSRVSTSFGKERVLSDVSFSIASGELACVVGPSGCGKSTILRIIGNLLPEYTGEVRVGGTRPADAWRRLGYVFQSPRLVPWRVAWRNVKLGMELRLGRSVPGAELDRRARESLELVGLGNDMDKFPAVMSGGERQRVSIARALAVDPDVILMDEPLSAVDAYTKLKLRDEILRIWRETGKTIVLVTHDVDEAIYLADRIIVLSAKPTQVIGNYVLGGDRPRDPDNDPALRDLKGTILTSLGAPPSAADSVTNAAVDAAGVVPAADAPEVPVPAGA